MDALIYSHPSWTEAPKAIDWFLTLDINPSFPFPPSMYLCISPLEALSFFCTSKISFEFLIDYERVPCSRQEQDVSFKPQNALLSVLSGHVLSCQHATTYTLLSVLVYGPSGSCCSEVGKREALFGPFRPTYWVESGISCYLMPKQMHSNGTTFFSSTITVRISKF